MKQNIYDNEIFFNGYSKIRENENNANNMFEKPALFSLLPTLNNKTVLDLGCGYGEHCIHFVEEGAKRVVGILYIVFVYRNRNPISLQGFTVYYFGDVYSVAKDFI